MTSKDDKKGKSEITELQQMARDNPGITLLPIGAGKYIVHELVIEGIEEIEEGKIKRE